MTPEQLLAAMPTLASTKGLAEAFADPISATMAEFEVSTPQRRAAFLAQVAHESMSLRRTREIWGPTPAQIGYEGRIDLGNTFPGDGVRYKGRGLLQITGRSNYRQCGAALDLDLVAHPEILETPTGACRSAGWFWKSRNLNAFADRDAFGSLTRAINGGYNGIDDRIRAWLTARKALGI